MVFELVDFGGYVIVPRVERRTRLRNGLQYFYSISVLIGVLATAFLMMERETRARLPLETLQSPSVYRLDAGVGDEALARLIEVEKALLTIRENSSRAKEGKPSRPAR